MKFLKEFSSWNPTLNKDVLDFIEMNKTKLLNLWDKDLSEDENMKLLIDFFTEYPDLMKSDIDFNKLTSLKPITGIHNTAPILQNIGGVRDFRGF